MKLNTYQKVAITTVGATIFLIFVGGLVRVSGSGLGCPDWPKCFGSWIPPTSAADLPPGFDVSQFNILKTWTEYLNRLVGVIIGALIIATFALSFRYRKYKPAVFYSSGCAFLMVLIQGWLGGEVVKSGLNEWLVSIHMVLAMAIMTVLLYAVFKATREQLIIEINHDIRKWLFWSGVILFVLTMAQMVLGTQVREAVDQVKSSVMAGPREIWIQSVGSIAEIHRSFAWTVLLGGIAIFYICRWKTNSGLLRKMGTGILAVIMLQIVLGAGLYYLGLPPVYQILHLVGVAILICLEFLLLLLVKPFSSNHSES